MLCAVTHKATPNQYAASGGINLELLYADSYAPLLEMAMLQIVAKIGEQCDAGTSTGDAYCTYSTFNP